jgi:hypothetical protein
MTTPLAPRPLTFGDTFTLPATGDEVWTIHDHRPAVAHLQREDGPEHLAYASLGHGRTPYAHYFPGTGWSVRCAVNVGEVQDDIDALTFDLAPHTPEEWAAKYQKMLGQQLKREVADIVDTAIDWTHGTDIDPLVIRAHLAAEAAVTAITHPAALNVFGDIYSAVYALALARLRDEDI